MEDNSHIQDVPPSFDINSEYQSNYLQSNYESDVYYELKTMEEDLDRIIKEDILKSETFASLRPLTTNDIVEGMEVKIFNEKKAKIVKSLGNDKFMVRLNGGSEMEVGINNLEPSVDPVMKLKKPQLIELYETCYNKLVAQNKGAVDIVNYFYVFTGYYHVNEKYLFSCLEPKVQAILLEEVKNRTNMKISQGIKPLFKSGQ